MTDAFDLDLDLVRRDVAWHMEKIMENFKPGAKITVYVRRPDVPDYSQDFLMGDDDPETLPDHIRGFMASKFEKKDPD